MAATLEIRTTQPQSPRGGFLSYPRGGMADASVGRSAEAVPPLNLDRMKWRGPVLDAMAAAVATVVTLAILSEGGLGTSDQGMHVFDGVGLVLALVTGLPLVFARRWPAAVFASVSVASLALLHLRYPLDIPLGPLYAAYVLVLLWGGAGPLRRTVATVAVVAYVPVVMVTLGLSGVNVWAVVTELSTWELAMTGLWFVAERSRLRQAELDAAEERIRRSEREAERENRLAAAEERTRIARELHDSAGHAINVILVQAGAARLLHTRDPEASVRALETVEKVARATIVDIDRMVHALRTESGEPAPADPAALEELLDHHRRSGLRLSTTFGGERRPLPRSVAWAAYRILQEALTNATRHGSGDAEVAVEFGAHAMEIAVSNGTTAAGPGAGSGARGANGRGHVAAGPHPADGGEPRPAATANASSSANAPSSPSSPSSPNSANAPSSANPPSSPNASGSANAPSSANPPSSPNDPGTRPDESSTTESDSARPGSGGDRPSGGHGLIGMRERATLLGGTFVAKADPAHFHIQVRLPYHATRAAQPVYAAQPVRTRP